MAEAAVRPPTPPPMTATRIYAQYVPSARTWRGIYWRILAIACMLRAFGVLVRTSLARLLQCRGRNERIAPCRTCRAHRDDALCRSRVRGRRGNAIGIVRGGDQPGAQGPWFAPAEALRALAPKLA